MINANECYGFSPKKNDNHTQCTLSSSLSSKFNLMDRKFNLLDSRSTVSGRSILSSVKSSVTSSFRIRKPTKSLLRLARQKKFDVMVEILLNSKCNFKAWFRETEGRKQGRSALHVVLEYQPPAQAVSLLLRRMKEVDPDTNPLTLQDKDGKTPLHVAVGDGCDAVVIDLLLQKELKDKPAAIGDNCDRYPLHWACVNQFRLTKPMVLKHATDESIESMVRIVSALVVAYPLAVHSKDTNGWTPVELAKLHKADERIMCILNCKDAADHVKAQPCQGDMQSKLNALNEIPKEVAAAADRNMVSFDSVSTLGWDDAPRGIKLFDWQKDTSGQRTKSKERRPRLRQLPDGRDLLVSHDPGHQNSRKTIEKCWFL